MDHWHLLVSGISVFVNYSEVMPGLLPVSYLSNGVLVFLLWEEYAEQRHLYVTVSLRPWVNRQQDSFGRSQEAKDLYSPHTIKWI